MTNYYGITHQSEPNYIAQICGDYFGKHYDGRVSAGANISTVVDLLESKGVSWAHYQEDMPRAGYNGNSYTNPSHPRDNYQRKHNPAIHFHSVTDNPDRLSRIKNMSISNQNESDFHRDLNANRLPQWMFITPNMWNDGHNSDVGVAGQWATGFLQPLLQNPNFNNNRTLVLITWDETETYSGPNHIFAMLLGSAVPEELVGTQDDSFYNHYSEISSISANWDLPTLGRWDVGANVFKLVGDKTGDTIRSWSQPQYFYNQSYDGHFAKNGEGKAIPKPNLMLSPNAAGRPILQSIIDTWSESEAPTYYIDSIEAADGLNPPEGY